jgi:hypothetical protein
MVWEVSLYLEMLGSADRRIRRHLQQHARPHPVHEHRFGCAHHGHPLWIPLTLNALWSSMCSGFSPRTAVKPSAVPHMS